MTDPLRPLSPLLLLLALRSLRQDPLPYQIPAPEMLAGVEVDRLPGNLAIVQPLPGASQPPATDPRFDRTLPFACAVYVQQDRLWQRRVIVRHTHEDRDSARRVARLCARLLRLHRERFGREARFSQAADEATLWLIPDAVTTPNDGGLTWKNQVYLFATTAMPTPLEWVRTVAHEWGHLTLPAARGFRSPENDAAGYLGERLFLHWMRQEGPGAGPDDGTRMADLERYYRRQIDPLLQRVQTAGPDSPVIDGAGTAAMDFYIGAALAAEAAFGAATLGRALFTITGERPRDFLTALRQAVEDEPVTVRLPAWVPFAAGDIRLAAAGGSGQIAIANRPPIDLARPTTLHIQRPAFKWVRAVSGNLERVIVSRVENRS